MIAKFNMMDIQVTNHKPLFRPRSANRVIETRQRAEEESLQRSSVGLNKLAG